MENLISPRTIKALMAQFGLQAKKTFGQNFLVDANTLKKIVAAAELHGDEAVFEVGPGLGTLTRELACLAGFVVAFESDFDLMPVLDYTLASWRDKVRVVPGDFLAADLGAVHHDLQERGFGRLTVVANLPYYITTPVLFHLFESGLPIDKMVFLVQLEVARRMVAPPGGKDYGSLSVAVQYRSCPEIVGEVPPTVFYPAPHVRSAILRLNMLSQPAVAVDDQTLFFRLVRSGFGQRRKTIANSVANCSELPLERDEWQGILERSGIDPRARAETLTISQFAALTHVVGERLGRSALVPGTD